MYIQGSSSPSFMNALISNNTADRGGGIYVAPLTSPTLTNLSIQYNAAQLGGGSYIVSGLWTNCTFQFNGALLGGGIVLSKLVLAYPQSQEFSLSNCSFNFNYAHLYGGGTYIIHSDVDDDDDALATFYNTSYNHNLAVVGGAVYYAPVLQTSVAFDTVLFNANQAHYGAAVFLSPYYRNSVCLSFLFSPLSSPFLPFSPSSPLSFPFSLLS